ncbi:MAG TPA: hypothetical protein VFE65_08415 [Pseudonocardia sp.]|jgi:hypothetical protein|nr:hypothetical protein [Pseudonocardia sp.]
MKRTLVAPIVVALALSLSPGTAYAGSGQSGANGSSNGSNGANGTANANCVGAIAIVIRWFGWGTGTVTQCKP